MFLHPPERSWGEPEHSHQNRGAALCVWIQRGRFFTQAINKGLGVVFLADDLMMTGGSKDLTILSGTLDLNGQTVTANGNVIIDSGTLTGSGTITNDLVLVHNGIVRLDAASIGVHDSIAIGNLADITSGSLVLDINGVTSGGLIDDLFTYDTGTGTFRAVTLLNDGVGFTVFETYNANDCDVFLNTAPTGTITNVSVSENTDGTYTFDTGTVDTTLGIASIG